MAPGVGSFIFIVKRQLQIGVLHMISIFRYLNSETVKQMNNNICIR